MKKNLLLAIFFFAATIVWVSSCSYIQKFPLQGTPETVKAMQEGESLSSHQSTSHSINENGIIQNVDTEKYTVISYYLNVRKTASSNSAILGTLPKGTLVNVSCIKGNWAEIEYQGDKAYVYLDWLEKNSTEPLIINMEDNVAEDSITKGNSYTESDSTFKKGTNVLSFFNKTRKNPQEEEYHNNELFNQYVIEGGKHLDSKRYTAAARSYNKALYYKTDASVWYNLGVAHYYNGNYGRAKRAFKNSYEEATSNRNSELSSKALEMKNVSAELAKEKSKDAWLKAAAITLLAVDVVLLGVANAEVQKLQKNSNLDPKYAMMQAQQQQAQINAVQEQLINQSMQQAEQQLYEDYLSMTNNGTSMTYGEWMLARAALDESNNMDISPLPEDDSPGYQDKLSPDQYEAAYRRCENSAQDYFRYLTSGGVRSQDNKGNIQGKTVGQISGGNYATWKQGLSKAQKEMKRIRQEAAQYGIVIQQSQWETATAGY